MKNRDKKNAILNLISLGSIDVFNLIIPIITMPILTRSIGIKLYGEYALLITIFVFGQLIVDYGINHSGIRDISRNINNREYISKEYSKYQGLRILIAFVYIFISILYSELLMEGRISGHILIYGSGFIFGHIFSSYWFLQSIEKQKTLLISSLLSRTTTLLSIVIFVDDKSDFELLMIVSTFSQLLFSPTIFLYLRKNYGVKLFEFKETISKLKSGFDVFISGFVPSLYNTIPIIIVGSISSPIEFAAFSVSTRICGVLYTVTSLFNRSIFPIISRRAKYDLNKILIFNFTMSIISIGIIGYLGKELLIFFTGNPSTNEVYLYILLFGMVFSSLSVTLGSTYFIPKNLDRVYRNISIKGAIISCFISAICIYFYGLVGCALGLTIARILMLLMYTKGFLETKNYEK